jgi:hypothetical protein
MYIACCSTKQQQHQQQLRQHIPMFLSPGTSMSSFGNVKLMPGRLGMVMLSPEQQGQQLQNQSM